MSTHLEFYSPTMRVAHTEALLRLLAQGCDLVKHPPLADETDSAFHSKPHTKHCILTGDFNFEPDSDEYALMQFLLRLLARGCDLVKHPPLADETDSAFQSKPHTKHCILTGDFNFEPDSDEYALTQLPQRGASRLLDAGPVARAHQAHTPTFRLHDRRYGPDPITCDFLFVSDTLSRHIKRVDVHTATRVSDHQPVLLELAHEACR